tara:strand:- start:203 stop:724 length:522 start_codon:yes stop_codon:yes gene_type:complete
MPVFTYLKHKRKKIKSKYHKVAKRFEAKYALIHGKVTSRFHRETTETELIRYKINNLITQSSASIESKIKSERFIPIFSKTSSKERDKFYPDVFDWLRGRFSGRTIRIVVREGKILEKIFLSPKGNRISVKRSKLEVRLRSMPSIKIKLRIRLLSMPKLILESWGSRRKIYLT